jgi:hypothetical protein
LYKEKAHQKERLHLKSSFLISLGEVPIHIDRLTMRPEVECEIEPI